jgi:hypothetical protein
MPYATRDYLAYTEKLLEREKKGEIIHDREFTRDMPIRDGECLEAIYLGIEINKEKKIEIIQKIKAINPNIKLYQMSVDENAFRLKAIEITK